MTKTPEERADGWFSALSGFGVAGRDKRMSVGFYPDIVSDMEAANLWRSDDLAARIIETLPDQALRQGFEINAGDKSLSEDVSAKLEDLDATAVFLLAKKYERAYGGAAILPVINDGNQNLAAPLNTERMPDVEHLQVFEPRELRPATYYTDPYSKMYGRPATYRLQPSSLGGVGGVMREIHESRLITFPGIRTSRMHISGNGWGDSCLNRVARVLSDFNIAWAATGVLLHDFAQASFKMKGLAELIATDRDDVIKARLRAVELSRSTIRAVLLDSEEEWERKQTPVSGLPELLDRFATRVAAAAGMPVTLLMGQSPAGLNATGASDIRFFYDSVGSFQSNGLRTQIEKLIRHIFLSINGPSKGKEPSNWSVEFNPLWQPSEGEIATTRAAQAGTDEKYINLGVLSPEDVARSRFSGDTYSIETVVDFAERDRLQKLLDDQDSAITNGPLGVGSGIEENAASTAFTGIQVTSMVDVVKAVGAAEISRQSALTILQVAFPITLAQAEEMLGPETFEPAAPETSESENRFE